MLYIRGAAWDYDNWAAIWAATAGRYADVLPVFKRAEANERGASEYHGGDGPLRVSDQHWPASRQRRVRRGGRAAANPAQRRFQRRAAGRRRPLSGDAEERRALDRGARLCRARARAAPISTSSPTRPSSACCSRTARCGASPIVRGGATQHVIRAKRGGAGGRRVRHAATADAVGDRPGRAPRRAWHQAGGRSGRGRRRTCRTMSTMSRRSRCRGAISSASRSPALWRWHGAIDPLVAQARRAR